MSRPASEVHVRIDSDRSIVEARQRGRALAEEAGFGLPDLAMIATAISELARNVLRFAGSGDVVIRMCDGEQGTRGVVITASDQGPGIPDLHLALTDGYSTAGGLGLGLPGVRRLMDELGDHVPARPRHHGGRDQMEEVAGIAQEYTDVLRNAVALSDEEALEVGYQFGRDLLERGHSLLEVVTIHRHAVAEITASQPGADPGRIVGLANRMLVEALVPFEMRQRALPEATARIAASEARYRDIVENASDVVFTLDPNGRFTSINAAGEKLSGYSATELLGMTVDRVVAPEHARLARVVSRWRPDALDGRHRYALDIVAKDGRRVPLDIRTRVVEEQGTLRSIQGIARDMTDRHHAETALRRLNSALEEKARRIAHALHDEAGQLLASVYFKLSDIEREPAAVRARLGELRDLLDQVDREIRTLSHELRPTILDDLGLIPALEFLGDGISRRHGVRVVVSGTTEGRLSADVETAVYRIAQEALTNATKHGRPASIHIDIGRGVGRLAGRIVDDGAGFDQATTGRGLGLVGMRERVMGLGGTLAISSSPGHGTTITFDLPLE